MATAAGIFEGITASINSVTIVNSAIAINGLLNEMNVIMFFLLPSIIGGTIFKDFDNEMHSVTFSYPFKKWEYLLAKFLSGLTITIIVMFFAAIGIMFGSILPGTNSELLGPFVLMNYVQSFLYYLIPNLIFYGAIVFAVVTFTRNVSVGFISVLGLIIIQSFASVLTQDSDNKILAAMLDPFGAQANGFYTEYWTIYERNENPLPFGDIILYNRLLWTGIGLFIFGFVYRTFRFDQEAFSFSMAYRKNYFSPAFGKPQLRNFRRTGGVKQPYKRWYNSFEMMGYVDVSEKGKLFARYRFNYQEGNVKNNFHQIQVGYSFYLFKKTSSKTKETGLLSGN
jgi:ABC-2 type transport system permease protein